MKRSGREEWSRRRRMNRQEEKYDGYQFLRYEVQKAQHLDKEAISPQSYSKLKHPQTYGTMTMD
jgi:hypothetical protein